MTQQETEVTRAIKQDRADNPTQTIHPWRATLRTMIAASIAFIPIGQYIAAETNLDAIPFVASFVAAGTVVSRVMVMPTTEKFLQKYAPWLSASAYQGQHREEN